MTSEDPRIDRSAFGALPDGRPVERFTLAGANGVSAAILTYGGILQRLEAPDSDGRIANVTLGFPELSGYLDDDYQRETPFFGALIGRYGNRIARGRFTLDGQTYTLPINHAPHSLHGGHTGFHVRLWDAEPVREAGAAGVRLSRVAADGENGYPGNLTVRVEYWLHADGRLRIEYAATTDAPTVVNFTNHAYWNLAGTGTVAGHELQIHADRYTPVDETLIPTGELAPVAGTPMDFRTPRPIGDSEPYDHNWVLNRERTGLAEAAVLRDPASGRTLTIATTEPGLQFFSADMLNGRPYPPRAGAALETQHFPDSPNHPHFPSTVLRPGERFTSTTVLAFATS